MPSRATWGWQGATSVPPVKACDWMFDLQEDDHKTPEHEAMVRSKPGDGRRILSRTSDTVVVEDRVGGGAPFQSTLRREAPDRLRVTSSGKKSKMDAAYRFEPEGEGSRIITEVHVEVGGFFGLLLPLFRKRLERTHQKDMGIHALYLERAWKEKPW